MDNKLLIQKLAEIVVKCDDTPEYESDNYKTGYVNSDMLTEVREDIQEILDELRK